MKGKKKWLLAQVKNLNNATDIIYMHRIIRREELAAKEIAPELTKSYKKQLLQLGAKISALFKTLQSHGIQP
jgi:predicted phage-related endonuclease